MTGLKPLLGLYRVTAFSDENMSSHAISGASIQRDTLLAIQLSLMIRGRGECHYSTYA
jgi:hypothetical protein